ncbi:MAG: hypothetical protein QGG40_21935, partial [Myxococcota bacterium]|nr:hypothetical protein [Myxococcota bacterium]
TDESGPEVIYTLETPTGGTLHLTVSDDSGVDVDLHVLSEADADACLARDDSEIEIVLDPGTYWIVADTYVGGYEFPGPYLLSGTFTGDLGSWDGESGGDSGIADGGDTGGPFTDTGTDDGSSSEPRIGTPPGTRVAMSELGGCSCSSTGSSHDARAMVAWLMCLGLVGWRRRSR